MNFNSYTAKINGEEIDVNAKELEVLKCLLDNNGQVLYHCGASSKDAGKKLCAINQITETAIIHPVIDRLLSLPDKKI